MTKYNANAHPEKRLFIRLLTRDISLVDAFLDMIDNSINAALKAIEFDPSDANAYSGLLTSDRNSHARIDVNFSPTKIRVRDNCGGISLKDAREEIFVFGAPESEEDDSDSLSVYGIGLKRALFKFGNDIHIISDHPSGGFELELDAAQWEKSHQVRWAFPIESRPRNGDGGTDIIVKELDKSVANRLSSSTFETELLSRVARAYSFFLGKVVDIYVNNTLVEPDAPLIGENYASDSFDIDDVSIYISAGIGIPKEGKRYLAERAGWNVLCNGRSVLQSDKSTLTGWGVPGYLPTFQPKHRPFVGFVFFASRKPASLPWTTTKLGVNPDNYIWQRALRRMADVARQVTRFLDDRYGEEGTSISSDELADARGEARSMPLRKEVATFRAPKSKNPKTTSIQFNVDREKLKKVKMAIGKPSMSNGEAGRYTFEYFVDNEMD